MGGEGIERLPSASDRDPADRPPRRVTAADVAALAGVSRSAVSRAFTEGAYLTQDKRSRILNAAMQLGYHPNAMAATMTGHRSKLVAVLSGDVQGENDAAFLASLVSALNAADKWPMSIADNARLADETLLSVLRYPLDTLIVRGGSVSAALVERCT